MAEIYERIPLRPVADLRGLATADATGVPAGDLYGALVEADTGLVRYLDLALVPDGVCAPRTEEELAAARHILVPIGHARIVADDAPHVKLRAALLEELQGIPDYVESDPIDDPYESAILDAHGRSFHGERYYSHPGYEHRNIYAGEHPILGEPPADGGAQLLQPLSELTQYRIASDEPDIRGWRIATEGAGSGGIVRDVVVDTAALKVRYVVVELERDDRSVLLPIGFLQLAADTETLHAPALRADDLDVLPAYEGGPVDRYDEDVVQQMLRDMLKGPRRYALPDFRPEMFYAT